MNPIVIFLLMLGIMSGVPYILDAVMNKSEKEASKGNGGCLGFILIATVLLLIICSVFMCEDSAFDSGNGNNWSPRHTELQEMHKNTQEMHIFS